MEHLDLLINALIETVFMVSGATGVGLALGVPLGIVLYLTHPKGLKPRRFIYSLLSFGVNACRSVPYIILMVLIIPFTRMLVGTSIGTAGALVPLSVAGLFLFARLTEDCLLSVPKGLLEVGIATGARTLHIITRLSFVECLPGFINGATTIVINMIGFSAMAGAVGGGGLGDLAIRYGYQRYDLKLMWLIVVILVVMVQLVQMGGLYLYRTYNKQ